MPVLWDKETNTIVSNESLEILRFLQTGFDSLLEEPYKSRNYSPTHLQPQIDEIGQWMQDDVNTGVYKAGFAPSQEIYDKNVVPIFKALNRLEKMLGQNGGPYILGQEMTELDLRLFPTLIRFDTVYVQHFKCNLGTIRHDYPLLNNWMKHLYWDVEGFKETTNFKHIKENVSLNARYLESAAANGRFIYSIPKVMETSILRLSHRWVQFQISRRVSRTSWAF